MHYYLVENDIVIASARRTQTVIGRKHETIKALARVATGEGERWSHGSTPLPGQELRRELLGTCANGRLFLRPNGKGIDLYWSNSNLSPGFDEKLRALIKAPAPVAVTKPVNGLHLGCLPPGRYLVAPRRVISGCQLWRVWRFIRLSGPQA